MRFWEKIGVSLSLLVIGLTCGILNVSADCSDGTPICDRICRGTLIGENDYWEGYYQIVVDGNTRGAFCLDPGDASGTGNGIVTCTSGNNIGADAANVFAKIFQYSRNVGLSNKDTRWALHSGKYYCTDNNNYCIDAQNQELQKVIVTPDVPKKGKYYWNGDSEVTITATVEVKPEGKKNTVIDRINEKGFTITSKTTDVIDGTGITIDENSKIKFKLKSNTRETQDITIQIEYEGGITMDASRVAIFKAAEGAQSMASFITDSDIPSVINMNVTVEKGCFEAPTLDPSNPDFVPDDFAKICCDEYQTGKLEKKLKDKVQDEELFKKRLKEILEAYSKTSFCFCNDEHSTNEDRNKPDERLVCEYSPEYGNEYNSNFSAAEYEWYYHIKNEYGIDYATKYAQACPPCDCVDTGIMCDLPGNCDTDTEGYIFDYGVNNKACANDTTHAISNEYKVTTNNGVCKISCYEDLKAYFPKGELAVYYARTFTVKPTIEATRYCGTNDFEINKNMDPNDTNVQECLLLNTIGYYEEGASVEVLPNLHLTYADEVSKKTNTPSLKGTVGENDFEVTICNGETTDTNICLNGEKNYSKTDLQEGNNANDIVKSLIDSSSDGKKYNVKKNITVRIDYAPSTNFYSNLDGKIFSEKEKSTTTDSLISLGHVFPISVATKLGEYNYNIKVSNVGVKGIKKVTKDTVYSKDSFGRWDAATGSKPDNKDKDYTKGNYYVYTCGGDKAFACHYKVIYPFCKEVCESIKTKDGKVAGISYTYRTISTNDVFKNDNRNGAVNWFGTEADELLKQMEENEESVLSKYQLDGSYVLDPQTMSKIREYNSNNDFSNNTITCDANGDCESSFFTKDFKTISK